MKPYVIGVSGKTGAGKSTLAHMLSAELKATLIAWDEFDEISQEPEDYVSWYHRGKNYSEFKRKALAKVLQKLKDGNPMIHPVLQQKLLATQYIVFDAPLGRLHQETGQHIDTCVHIEVPLDVLLCRRALRDFRASTKTKEELLAELQFYLHHSRPLFFDADLKQSADVVVDGLLSPEQEIQVIISHLTRKPR